MKGSKERMFEPVLAPALRPGKSVKDATLAIRLAPKAKEWIENELQGLGVEPKNRAHFYRGAILAAIGNVKRSQDPAWNRFVKSIQPQARKHLGAKVDFGGASTLEHLGFDGPTVNF